MCRTFSPTKFNPPNTRKWQVITILLVCMLCSWSKLASKATKVAKDSLTLFQTTNFTLFQAERVCRRQKILNWWKWQKVLRKVKEHCGKKEKFFLTSNWWKWQKVLHKVKEHCGKRRNCSWRAISPFPTAFSKDLHCKQVKNKGLFGKGLRANNWVRKTTTKNS